MKSVSITIPCRNEEHYIGKCLQSIVDCDFDKSLLSVFVCDGTSTDNTQAIIQEFIKKYPFIHFIENTKQTTPFALNLGLKANSADIKIILGAHAEIYPDYINKCIEAFKINEKLGCVGGIIENVYENDTAEIIGKAMKGGIYLFLNSPARKADPVWGSTNFPGLGANDSLLFWFLLEKSG